MGVLCVFKFVQRVPNPANIYKHVYNQELGSMKSFMHGFGQTSLNRVFIASFFPKFWINKFKQGVYSIIFSQISIFCTTSLLADLSQKVQFLSARNNTPKYTANEYFELRSRQTCIYFKKNSQYVNYLKAIEFRNIFITRCE